MATSPERLPSYIKPGVSKFTELEDAPKSYTGQAGKAVKVKTTEDGLEFGTAGVTKFIELSDVPSSYTGQAGKAVQVKSTEDGLEFQTIVSGKRTATKIVAASDSLDKSRADYVCDGVADQDEINAAINALPTSGGRVLLLEGTYNISGTITILKNYVTLEGQGAGTKLFLVNGANCHAIQVGNGSTALEGIRIANLRIDGNKANQTTSVHGIYFYGASGYLITKSGIENCIVENCANTGIYLYYSNNNIIAENQANSNWGAGIYLYYSNNNVITGNQTNSTYYYGIYLISSNNNIIAENQAISNRIDGFYIYLANNNIIIGNQVNSTTNGSGMGILHSSYNIVIGNECQGNNGYGINIVGSNSNNNLVVKNYLTGNTSGALSNAGTGTIIEGNIGYSTEYIKSTGASVTIGTGGAYGAATAFTPLSGIIRGFDLNINIGGTFGQGETVTVKIESVYSDGSTGYIEKSFTATGSLALSPTDKISLIKDGVYITKINVYAKTNLTSTTVTCSVDIAAAT
jgi:parallel beta-helix repeat protein